MSPTWAVLSEPLPILILVLLVLAIIWDQRQPPTA